MSNKQNQSNPVTKKQSKNYIKKIVEEATIN